MSSYHNHVSCNLIVSRLHSGSEEFYCLSPTWSIILKLLLRLLLRIICSQLDIIIWLSVSIIRPSSSLTWLFLQLMSCVGCCCCACTRIKSYNNSPLFRNLTLTINALSICRIGLIEEEGGFVM